MSEIQITRPLFSLTLSAADTICNGAIAAVPKLKFAKPVVVTVLDNTGGVLCQKRMDGCPSGAFQQFSFTKARTCIHLQASSRGYRVKHVGPNANGEFEGPPMFTQGAAMASVMAPELIPIAGGVLIRNAEGFIIGSVGVSGCQPDEDEYLALEGIKCLNDDTLDVNPPVHSCTTLLEE